MRPTPHERHFLRLAADLKNGDSGALLETIAERYGEGAVDMYFALQDRGWLQRGGERGRVYLTRAGWAAIAD